MHPLPKDSHEQVNELDDDLNRHPNLTLFRLADNGRLIRMALFALTLGVDSQGKKYECLVNWYSRKANF